MKRQGNSEIMANSFVLMCWESVPVVLQADEARERIFEGKGLVNNEEQGG